MFVASVVGGVGSRAVGLELVNNPEKEIAGHVLYLVALHKTFRPAVFQ